MPAISEVYICNLALRNIGSGKTISSLTESSNEAGYCNDFYSFTRDEMLRGHPWQFATKRRTLALSSEASPSDWGYVYEYPSDCLNALSILQSNRRERTKIPFEIGLKSDNSGKVIYTDEAQATLKYTAKVTDPQIFDMLFVDSLAWGIAARIAMPLVNKEKKKNDAINMQNNIVRQAYAVDRMEKTEDEQPESEFLSVRY